MKRAVVIGAGFAGLASTLLLLREGWQVTVLEKHDQPGGRARLWEEGGFRFDMGPSWYLMPEVFERFFESVGTSVKDLYQLTKLDPQYRVFFETQPPVTVTADPNRTRALFESLEPGSGHRFDDYLKRSREKYRASMDKFLYRSYATWRDLADRELLTRGWRLGLLGSLHRFVRRFVSDRRATQILEYAMVFLGTSPKQAPALYSLLSHVDFDLGVSFPQGGMNGVARAMARLAADRGAKFLYGREVSHLEIKDGRVTRVVTDQGGYEAEAVLNTADYAWSETELLERRWQSYPRRWWKRRVFTPSMFLLFLGISRRVPGLEHHNLYFSDDWDQHFDALFRRPRWPENPCFYVSAITKTDASMAPPGCENLFILVPVAPGLDDTDETRRRYRDLVIDQVERRTRTRLRDAIATERVYGPRDFQNDYHAWNGTALGLAHTLFQTALFRPKHRSRRVKNLWYAGQYTHPGVGVPMTLISAQVAVTQLLETHRGA
jgi:phytoene desaturase